MVDSWLDNKGALHCLPGVKSTASNEDVYVGTGVLPVFLWFICSCLNCCVFNHYLLLESLPLREACLHFIG